LHPLSKLVLVACIDLIGFLARWPQTPWLLFAVVVMPLAASGQIARPLLRAVLTVVLPFAISVTLIQAFFFPGTNNIWVAIGPLLLKQEGLVYAYGIIGRLLLLAGSGLLLLFSTRPSDLALALTQIGMPRQLSYILVAAIQLVPQLQTRAATIVDAQRARGLETEGSTAARAKALLPLLAPLIGGALADVDERAIAMEARAFNAPGPKTSFMLLSDTRAEAWSRWLLAAATLAICAWEIAAG
jgi:energy-coupling factor transport system permease protein